MAHSLRDRYAGTEHSASWPMSGAAAADRLHSARSFSVPLIQRAQPRPYSPTHPIELMLIDDTRHIASGVVAGVRDAPKADGGNAGRGVRPVITCEVRAGSRDYVGSTCRYPQIVAEAIASAVRRADRYIAGAYAHSVQRHHGLDCPTLRAVECGHVLSRAEVVQRITAAPRLLGTEGNELHGQSSRLLLRHRSQLQHDGDAGGVVFSAGCNRHGVQVGADHHMWLARVETHGLGDHIDRGPTAYGRAPRVSSGHPYLRPPDVIAQALEAVFDKGGRLREVRRGCLARANLRGQVPDVAERRSRVHGGSGSSSRGGSYGCCLTWCSGGRAGGRCG